MNWQYLYSKSPFCYYLVQHMLILITKVLPMHLVLLAWSGSIELCPFFVNYLHEVYTQLLLSYKLQSYFSAKKDKLVWYGLYAGS